MRRAMRLLCSRELGVKKGGGGDVTASDDWATAGLMCLLGPHKIG